MGILGIKINLINIGKLKYLHKINVIQMQIWMWIQIQI
jgi:hypothetical protein